MSNETHLEKGIFHHSFVILLTFHNASSSLSLCRISDRRYAFCQIILRIGQNFMQILHTIVNKDMNAAKRFKRKAFSISTTTVMAVN